jgi:hypothetical protein
LFTSTAVPTAAPKQNIAVRGEISRGRNRAAVAKQAVNKSKLIQASPLSPSPTRRMIESARVGRAKIA